MSKLAGLGLIFCAAVLFAAPAAAGAQTISAPPYVPRAALVHHAVTTTVPEAQAKFDEGLTLIYAFNRDEAARRFEAAAKADPALAMAWWGVALANGPNLNVGMSKERVAAAQAALAKAKGLEAGASAEERRYVEALAVRYPATFTSDEAERPGYVAYRAAMDKLHTDYPDDLDAATLYVESSMDVDDWGWEAGHPIGVTAALEATLESVLARDPGHVGANHYYVHLMDFVGVADRALPSARRLSALPVEPAASHLQHMSGHNYLDLGLFAALERDNRQAVDDDRAYAASINAAPTTLDYFEHNLDFYVGGALMLDDRSEVDRAVEIARSAGQPALGLLAYAREGRWDDVLATPAPNSRNQFESALWHYTRGLAFAARGDGAGARVELAALDSAAAGATGYVRGFFTALDRMLGARVAHLEGDDSTAVARLRAVVATIAPLPPEVFAPWFYPAGEWLGDVLFASGDFAGAEAAFRADLARTPHNARVLYGLMRVLAREGRLGESRALAPEIAANWRGPYEDLRPGI